MGTMNAKKLKVGIIMGGMSSEKEVSLESGRNIYSKISHKKYDPISVFMDSQANFWEIPARLLMRNSTMDVEVDLEQEAAHIPYEELKRRVDFVYLCLHGKYGEDGCVQGLLELLRIPYTGSGVLGSALGADKYTSRNILRMNGIDVPETIQVIREQWDNMEKNGTLERIEEDIGFPCVVKPVREGCSTAVRKVASKEGIFDALSVAFEWDNSALIEEFIDGTEVTCGVIGNDEPAAMTPSETIPTGDILSLEDKFLYGQGENKTPARVPDETLKKIQGVAVRTFRALGLKVYARIDMFVRQNGSVAVLESNTLPGMTPSTVLFHQAAASGIDQSALIDQIIQLSMEVHANKKGPL
jgi:D-alanine--D-alanine ligase